MALLALALTVALADGVTLIFQGGNFVLTVGWVWFLGGLVLLATLVLIFGLAGGGRRRGLL